MTLDIATLFIVTVFTLSVSGLLLLFAWLQNRDDRPLLWWAGAFMLFAPSTALFGGRGIIANAWSIEVGNILLLLGYGLMWTGARIFEGRRPLLAAAIAGAAIWFVACRFDAFFVSGVSRVVLASTLICIYSLLFIRELWLGRSEPLISRWPVMALVALHAVLFPVRVPTAVAMPDPFGSVSAPLLSTLLVFAPLFYTFAFAFLLMALTKERVEHTLREAATNDTLTGISNRRGFSERAQRITARAARDGLPLTLMLFDLDQFKGINDRFGHRIGDRVLALFSDCASHTLRPLDLIGRMGGDEFMALLSGVTPEAAPKVAERVRNAFAITAREIDGCQVEATVSIGIACATTTPYDFDLLCSTADAALYRAKRQGRNRIEQGDITAPEPTLQPTAMP